MRLTHLNQILREMKKHVCIVVMDVFSAHMQFLIQLSSGLILSGFPTRIFEHDYAKLF